MFCDLVDSTGLSEKLDAEDLRELLGVYQKTVGAVIARFDGHIAQYLGDGIMAYFGWPHAHEEDAERAIRAAMEIVNAIPEMRATEFLLKEPLRVRIGVATGPVVLGETGSGDAAVPKAAVGTTPNEAARLQGLAGPNEIVISPVTRQLAGRAFDYDDMGEQRLKGISAPVRPWRVLSENTGTNRFKARAEDKLLPLVGRDSEIRMLLARWRKARRGDGQVVMLSGEPGIGKSRVIFEFQQRLDANLPVLTYQCSPFYTNTALHPFVGYFERAAGFKRYPTALLRTQLE